MRLINFFKVLLIINIVAFLYAHQRIEVFKLSYGIRKKELKVSNLIDHNAQLRYNVAKIKSPEHIENILVAKSINSDFVRRKRIVITRLSPKIEIIETDSIGRRILARFNGNKILDVLVGSTEAEAQIK